ncbi:MAG: DNA topoisomerase IB [Actinomycetota bacterium]|nr:DNA topoisomerase IB [Actinomycetota bacterium]
MYLDENGRKVTDLVALERIRSLVIPPAWNDVWVCSDPLGHIQAVGTDAKGRKQYRYHDHWRMRRDQEKFDHMLEFARSLSALRRTSAKHMRREEMDRERVLGCAARLLDLGFFRIGSEDYAEQNQTYGLATILKEHTKISGRLVTFDYVAKGGKQRVQSVADPAVVAILATLKRRRGGGPELLAYKQQGRWLDVRSGDINAYIKEVTGGDFSAKDFRTWNATVLTAVALAVSHRAETKTARKSAVSRAIAEAAHYLGNTPAVCRASYVDPRVIDRYFAGVTIAPAVAAIGAGTPDGSLPIHGPIEKAVIDLLEDAPQPRTEKAA